MQPIEGVDQHDGVGAARCQPPRLVDDQLDGVVLRFGGRREAHDGARLHGTVSPIAEFLRPDARECGEHGHPVLGGEDLGELAQQVRLAGPGAAADRHARATAKRSQELNSLQRRVVGAEFEALARKLNGQIVEASAIGQLLGGATVDRVDAHQRRETLGTVRGAARAGDAVAVHQLAALDLGGGDVDVVVRRLRR